MTQFKEKSEKQSSTNVGLFSYPVLQAADVLLYNADVVPVGEDQLQHLELTRVLTRRFNSAHGRLFKEPEPYVAKEVSRIMSLSDPAKKMSKSGDQKGVIFLNDTPDIIRKKVRTAVTDSGSELDPRHIGPAIANLLTIYSSFSGRNSKDILEEFDGKGYAEFKDALADVLIEKLTPIREQFTSHLENTQALLSTLQLGAKKAEDTVIPVLRDMKRRMGLTEIT